mgnify:FL=1
MNSRLLACSDIINSRNCNFIICKEGVLNEALSECASIIYPFMLVLAKMNNVQINVTNKNTFDY